MPLRRWPEILRQIHLDREDVALNFKFYVFHKPLCVNLRVKLLGLGHRLPRSCGEVGQICGRIDTAHVSAAVALGSTVELKLPHEV